MNNKMPRYRFYLPRMDSLISLKRAEKIPWRCLSRSKGSGFGDWIATIGQMLNWKMVTHDSSLGADYVFFANILAISTATSSFAKRILEVCQHIFPSHNMIVATRYILRISVWLGFVLPSPSRRLLIPRKCLPFSCDCLINVVGACPTQQQTQRVLCADFNHCHC